MSAQNHHQLSIQAVLQRLDTDQQQGLSDHQAAQRREKYGPNRLTQQRQKSPLIRFLLQFHQPLVYILLAACTVTLALREWADSVVIFAVVLVNAMIGFIQEAKALSAISALSRSVNTQATVIRAGKRQRLDAEHLVPGDIVVLSSGDKVPADLRLLSSRDLHIDESALTGESVASAKSTPEVVANAPLGDRHNMAYSSTLVTFGQGIGAVTATGDETEIGKISSLLATTQTLDTPLTMRIKQFSHVLLYAILALAAVTLLVGYFHHGDLAAAFMPAVALAVGAIPEGLPAAVTIMLAIGVSRMAKRRAIIRNLPAVETLGSTTVICSDKTGTLTKNEMTVTRLWLPGMDITVEGAGYEAAGQLTYTDPQGQSQPLSKPKVGVEQLLQAGAWCNEADIEFGNDSSATVVGDPTEAALLVVAAKAGMDIQSAARNAHRVDTLPFSSELKYMATLHRTDTDADSSGSLVYVKGALEQLLPHCRQQQTPDGQYQDIDPTAIQARAEHMAAQGLRVLLLAKQMLPSPVPQLNHDMLGNGLIFLGLQAMLDPPRPEAATAIADCQRAGISVRMITGDHALTAASIAAQLNIIEDTGQEQVITGQMLDKLTPDQWPEITRQAKVFARVSPEHKLRLVETLQAQGHVIAMTGDGVNDAPALRRADIGVAMAQNGTEVAREAADMMLTDDNFATIAAAVEEGRGVYDNLKKFIVWTLPTNGGEALVVLLAVILGISLPLQPLHILWVNMTTAVCLGLMLAFEPKEAKIMLRQPHSPNAAILDKPLLWRIVLVSSLLCLSAFGLYELELHLGATLIQAQTVAVSMFVVGEAFYLFNCRSLTSSVFKVGFFTNPWIGVGIALMALLQLAFVYLPAMNQWFHSEPMSGQAWLRILACGLVMSVLIGLEKQWRLRQARAQQPPLLHES